MITRDAEPVVLAYFKAVDEMQLDELMRLFDEHASLHYPLSEPIVGKENIRSFYQGVFMKYARGKDHIKRLYFSDDCGVAAEIFFEATLKTGKEVAFEAVDLFTISNSKIQRIQVNYDSAKVMQDIGPPPTRS